MSALDYPSMPRNEYEWLSCTVLPDNQTVTLYKHKMSKRAVMIFKGKDQNYTTVWLPAEMLVQLKEHF